MNFSKDQIISIIEEAHFPGRELSENYKNSLANFIVVTLNKNKNPLLEKHPEAVKLILLEFMALSNEVYKGFYNNNNNVINDLDRNQLKNNLDSMLNCFEISGTSAFYKNYFNLEFPGTTLTSTDDNLDDLKRIE
ncbi:MAG: hypothetical protein KIT27_01330 [Legionellales bacterium]|nr:hypothetical protein [Legionellales bacterium]